MAWRRSGVRIPIAPLERPCSGPSGPFAGSLFFPGGDPRAPDVRSLALAHLVCGVARRTSEVGGLRPPRRALVLFGGATPVPPCVRSLALAHLVCGVARWARSVFAGSLLFSGGRPPVPSGVRSLVLVHVGLLWGRPVWLIHGLGVRAPRTYLALSGAPAPVPHPCRQSRRPGAQGSRCSHTAASPGSSSPGSGALATMTSPSGSGTGSDPVLTSTNT